MEKKIYTKPAMDVVAFSSNDVICTSVVNSISGNSGMRNGGSSANDTSGQGARANNRSGIWDED